MGRPLRGRQSHTNTQTDPLCVDVRFSGLYRDAVTCLPADDVVHPANDTPGDVSVKKVDRQGFLSEVTEPHSLSHVETVDKSAPHTEGAAVKPNAHGAVFAEIKSKQ